MQKKRTKLTHSKSSLKKGSKSIWWAVDPFHDDNKFSMHALEVLTPFAQAVGSPIIPVSYIDTHRALTDSGHRFPLISDSSEPLSALKALAAKRLLAIGSQGFKKVLGTQIFLTHEILDVPSLRGKVEAISRAAKQRGALFVALHSHSHSGIKRLYMGSFAETFMLYSQVPTLIINPRCLPKPQIRNILFPTDFSKESLIAFNVVLDFAARLGAMVSVAHYADIPILSNIFQGKTREQFEKRLKETHAAIRRDGARLEAIGLKRQVKTEFHLITEQGLFDPSGGLLKFSKSKKMDLIAMAAQSGPLQTTLVGATSRELARSAECPVLIYRS